MSSTAFTDEKIQNAMRLANRLVAEMAKATEAAYLASLSGLVSHLTTDPFLKSVTDPLTQNTKVNFSAWYAQVTTHHKYEPPANRHDEAALLFRLFQKIDRREQSISDFMFAVDQTLRMDKSYQDFTTKYVRHFMDYLDWVIKEKLYLSAMNKAIAAEQPAAPAPAIPAIALQKIIFDTFLDSLRQAVEQALPPEEKEAALQELTVIAMGFEARATPAEVTAAAGRLCQKYDYFRTRLQDFTSGAGVLHLVDDLPPFIDALRIGAK